MYLFCMNLIYLITESALYTVLSSNPQKASVKMIHIKIQIIVFSKHIYYTTVFYRTSAEQ